MKYATLILLLFITSISSAQEFKIFENGLIYSPQTMHRLALIVDSLNLKFKTCEQVSVYYSKNQARGHHIWLDSMAEDAREFIQTNPDFQSFVKKYPFTEFTEDLLIVQHKTNNESGQSIHKYISYPKDHKISVPYTERHMTSGQTGNWVYLFYDMSDYKKASVLEAFFIEIPFHAKPLPPQYSRMIQYVDCMVDTTNVVFSANASFEKNWYNYAGGADNPPAVDAFYQYIDLPDNPLRDSTAQQRAGYNNEVNGYPKRRAQHLQDTLAGTAKFGELLTAAVNEAIANGIADAELETWAGQYISPEMELKMKRLRRVSGSCSQDPAPREHALAIAQLAAETAAWEIFLRAHLNILNDYFSRSSDASYAQYKRGTYIQELEELGFDIPALLLGISLRAENTASGHYYGQTDRIGRALAESRNQDSMSEQISKAIADPNLDDFNRLLFWNLYQNMAHWQAHAGRTPEGKKAQFEQTKSAIAGIRQTLPAYLAKQLEKG